MHNARTSFLLAAILSFANPAKIGAGQVCSAPHTAEVANAIEKGKTVLIVAYGSHQSCGDEDETCGDWADHLNSYASARQNKVVILKIPSNQWPTVVHFGVDDISPRSTLFMMKGRPSFFYSGAIIEPRVYKLVEKSWADQQVSPEASSYGLKQVTVGLCGQ